jgi:hypothetical protein
MQALAAEFSGCARKFRNVRAVPHNAKVGRASRRAGFPRWNSVARLTTIHAARQESGIPNHAPGK